MVEQLAAVGCSNIEIGHLVSCHADTISRRFAAQIDKGRSGQRTRLRQLLWQLSGAWAIREKRSALCILIPNG